MYLHSDTKLYHDILLWICRTDLRMSCTTTFFCGYVVRTSECHARLSVDKSYGRHIHRVPYLHSDTTFHHKFLLWKYRTDLRSPANTSYGPQNVMHHDILWVCRTDDISIVWQIFILLTQHSTTTFFCGYVVRTSGFLQIRRTDLRMSYTTFCGYVVRMTYPSCDKFSFWHDILLWICRTDLSDDIKCHSIMYSQKSFCSVSQIKYDTKCHSIMYSQKSLYYVLSEVILFYTSLTHRLTQVILWVMMSDSQTHSIDWFWLPIFHTNLVLTSRASVAQLVRARDCQSLGRRFDSV